MSHEHFKMGAGMLRREEKLIKLLGHQRTFVPIWKRVIL